MESISRLRTILLTSLGSRGTQHGEQELFDELMLHQQCLLKLFDVGPRNPQEQREIESGNTVVNGRSIAVNADFARQVLFLSQQLDCSERYVAGMLHTIMSQNPNIGSVSCIEAVIVEFHQRRRQLVDCLRYIFEAAELAEATDVPSIFVRLDAFTRRQLTPAVHAPTGGDVTLALTIFREMENLGNDITKIQGMKQIAVSNTAAPSNQGGSPTLGYDILNARLDSLKYERRYLAKVLFSIARLGYLSAPEIKKMVEWLALNPFHAMTYNVLTATLVAFDPVDPESNGGKARKALAMENSIMSFMKTKLEPSAEWKDQGLKATILLKWTLFLTDIRHGDHSLENTDGFRTEDLETRIWNSIQGDAFVFLTQAVIHLQNKNGSSSSSSYCRDLSLSMEQEQQRELPVDDFKLAVLQAFENLVRSLITHASSELRKIKQRQEDLVMSSARTDRSRFRAVSMPSPADQTSPRNDIALLYSLIGLLYAALPAERALQFWGSGPQADSHRGTYLEFVESTSGKLPTFLQWAIWSTQMRDQDMLMALYDMLAGLSKGQHCSELAYNFMARGGGEVIPGSVLPSSSGTAHYSAGPTVSWSVIFSQLETWAAPSPNARPNQVQAQLGLSSSQPWHNPQPQASQHSPQQIALGRKEVLLAQAFLRLLSNVVTHSVAVRIAISGNAHFRAIPTLVALIPLGIPMELKGALFEALAAFCEPGAGIPGIEICKAVWTLMERLEVINVRSGSGLLPSVKGVEVELEEVEASHKLYPATIPFLKLLSTLIHTPKRVQLKEVVDVEPTNTTPESLGQPYRLPGIGPFISFVVDNVFSKIPHREYLRPSDRWQTNDLCLCFIERSLASYDLESLLSSEDDLRLGGGLIGPLLVHPGYDVMKRLLTNSPLQASVLSYLVEGVEGFEKDLAEEEPYFRSTIIRVLRIVHRILEIQDIFMDILIPLLSEFDSAPIVGVVHTRSYYTKFDQALSFGPQYVPAVAAYVAFPAYPELVLLSVKILSSLSSSTAFTNLATLIERSGDSERILNGFRLIMESEALDDVDTSQTLAERTTGAGAPDREDGPESLEQAIRLATLNLFVENTEHRRSYPNIAHFLLFGGHNNEQPIQDPHALGSHRACIHVILDMLNAGVPRLKGKGSNREPQIALHTDPLFVTLPGLAERCYRVIYQLCVHPHTSDFTMRYLRTREDFFARQLAVIPSEVPPTLEVPFIEVLYNDGSRVTTTVSALSSFLRLRSCILDLVALDLHVLTNKGHHKGVTNLLEILFGNETAYHDPSSEWDYNLLRPFQEVGQSHLRIIEFVQSLAFDWSDSLIVSHVELEFLNQLNLHSCIRVDVSGCEVVDKTALLLLLATAQRSLHTQGRIVTSAHAEQLRAETAYILESCAVENHRREVVYSVVTGYESWRRLLDTTLVKCFGRLPHDGRENMLFDLLHVLPGIIRSPDVQESSAVLLSEAVLSSITKLREDRNQQIVIQSAGGDADAGSLPVERLKSLLRSLLECILDNNRLELVRGNLYAALINYLHLVASTRTDEGVIGRGLTKHSLSLSTSATQEDFVFSDSQSSIGAGSQFGGSAGPSSALESGSLAVMKGVIERLIATIARDAIDGTEVWKTVAFMSLDSLVQLSRSEKSHVVLSALVRHGILSNFVRGLKESDLRLQAVLKPDPDDLNSLYVYEAKLSLFIRMAQTRPGAEKLLETQILPTLTRCDYLDARPEADQSFMDQDTFLPSAIQRYHQLFMPVLQLVHGMLATLGPKHSTAAYQTLDFLSNHRDTIIILLKNENAFLSLSLVDEIHLLVSLCANVLPLVANTELVSHSGFGGIHGAVLALVAKCLGSGRWIDDVRPQTDAELVDASVYGVGQGSMTKFDQAVKVKERLVRKAMVAYLGAASQFTEPEICLVLSPVTTAPRQVERSSHFIATIPTVGDAVEALYDLCVDLADTLKQIADLSAELSLRDHIRIDNIQEIITVPDAGFLQELDIGQKRSLVYRELERVKADIQGKAKATLSTLEMLLLLLWRHIAYYCEGHHINNPDLRASTSYAIRFLSSPDAETFRSEAGIKLTPALQKLSLLDLVGRSYFAGQDLGRLTLSQQEDTIGNGWRSNQGYIEIMCRRLRDTAGLHDVPE